MNKRFPIRVVVLWSLAFASSAAEVNDWILIEETSLGEVRMDPSSISKNGSFTQGWFSYDFKKQQRLTKQDEVLFTQRKDQVQVSCDNNQFGIIQSDFYDQGKLTYHATEADKIRYVEVRPDTMAFKLFEKLCPK